MSVFTIDGASANFPGYDFPLGALDRQNVGTLTVRFPTRRRRPFRWNHSRTGFDNFVRYFEENAPRQQQLGDCGCRARGLGDALSCTREMCDDATQAVTQMGRYYVQSGRPSKFAKAVSDVMLAWRPVQAGILEAVAAGRAPSSLSSGDLCCRAREVALLAEAVTRSIAQVTAGVAPPSKVPKSLYEQVKIPVTEYAQKTQESIDESTRSQRKLIVLTAAAGIVSLGSLIFGLASARGDVQKLNRRRRYRRR